MGYQNLHDTSGQEANEKAARSSNQKTSVTAAKAQDTTKAQYWRLNGGGQPVGTGE